MSFIAACLHKTTCGDTGDILAIFTLSLESFVTPVDNENQKPLAQVAMNNGLRLAEMLCTRLCHDLTGPIGAVNNGAEFLSEEGFDMQNEAMQLILSSATEAVHRLQFYRQCYGRIGEQGEASLSEKKQLAEQFFESTKITLDWPASHTDASGIAVSHRYARVLLNMLLIASSALIKGGTLAVRVAETPEGAKEISVEATGESVKMDAEILDTLRGRAPEQLTPKLAQVLLTYDVANEIGVTFDPVFDAGMLRLRAIQSKQA